MFIYNFTTVLTDALRRLNNIGVAKQAGKTEKEKKYETNEDTGTEKRRRGGSAPLGVITNVNNVITQTLSK